MGGLNFISLALGYIIGSQCENKKLDLYHFLQTVRTLYVLGSGLLMNDAFFRRQEAKQWD